MFLGKVFYENKEFYIFSVKLYIGITTSMYLAFSTCFLFCVYNQQMEHKV